MSDKFKNGELTVGELLDFIQKNNIPRDAKVFYQRIEDRYFDKNNYPVVKKEGEHYFSALKFNKNIAEGEFEHGVHPHSEEKLESFKEQYVVAQATVKYKDDENLYIDALY